MSNDLLFELGCEELPSGSVWPMADAFSCHLLAALDKAGLAYGDVTPFASPRRIGLLIKSLQGRQDDKTITRKGPALKAAFDEKEQPTAALMGFARSCGVQVEALQKEESEKGSWIIYQTIQKGKTVEELLPALISQTLKQLPIPRTMRWGNASIEFARPVHWVVLLYGKDVIDAEILGVKTSNISRGHRFHYNKDIPIECPDNYEVQMQQAHIIPHFETRRKMILKQVEELAASKNAQAVIPDELLDEVTSIVEWPKALLAKFNETFLDIPPEVLIASMQSHQKCFALKDADDSLLPFFITVANIESKNEKEVIKGNEKVMDARLNDASFFYHQDKKHSLSDYIEKTSHVIFQKKLGTLHEKSLRIQSLMTQWTQPFGLEGEQAKRAAFLSKCDLMTGMVEEFPELQGLMGYYYALNDGEDEGVAYALNEQYMPRFSGDNLPASTLGLALSLADRIDSIVGIFAIGQKPSGVKDPFKLRRHALAIVRILTSTESPLQLTTLLKEGAANYIPLIKVNDACLAEIKSFIIDRLQSYYQGQGISVDLIHAVLSCQNEWLYDFNQRLTALKSFILLPEAEALSAACKRVNNILSNTPNVGGDVSEELLQEEAEKSLYHTIIKVKEELAPYYRKSDYMAILQRLADLRQTIDTFFDKVMVMVDDPRLKENRLKIVLHLQTILMGVADISRLQLIRVS